MRRRARARRRTSRANCSGPRLKLDLTAVPFHGGGPMIQSVLGGHTPIAFSSLPPAAPLIRDGAVRALAVTTAKRVSLLPDVPTLEEAGYPGQEGDTPQCVLVPAGTPRAIVELLHREILRIIALPDVKEKFAAHRLRADRHHAGGVCRAHQGRRSALGEDRPRGQYQGGLTLHFAARRCAGAAEICERAAPDPLSSRDSSRVEGMRRRVVSECDLVRRQVLDERKQRPARRGDVRGADVPQRDLVHLLGQGNELVLQRPPFAASDRRGPPCGSSGWACARRSPIVPWR